MKSEQNIQWNKLAVESENNCPLYESFAGMIRKLILSGKLKPGTPIPPSRKLVSMIHLSCNTIERGFHLLVQEGYLIRRPRVGTFVAQAQTVHHQRRTDHLPPLVMLICGYPRFARPNKFQLLLLETLHKVFDPLNWRIRLAYPEQDEHPEMLCRRIVKEDKPDAVMLAGFTYTRTVTSLFQQNGIRLVTIGEPDDFDNVCFAATDHRKGMRDCVRHLLKAGHRRILLIDNTGHKYSYYARFKGYCDAFSEQDLQPDARMFLTVHHTNDHQEEFSAEIRELTRWKCSFTAAITYGEYWKYLNDYCRSRKIRIPEDLSLIYYGNKDDSSTTLPENCTSVSWDVEELGCEAAKLLMAEQFRISKNFFPARLVPGKSVRRLSANDRK